jgi:endonuclease YncB( thermonuclease family)
MPGSSRKPEGSDVRSKFELRREQIRQRVVDGTRAARARVQAASVATTAGLRAAGSAVAAGARVGRGAAAVGAQRTLNSLAATGARMSGLRALPGSVRAGARAGRRAAASGARRTLDGLAAIAAFAGQQARAARSAAAHILARPATPGAVGAAGALVLGAGIGRWRAAGLDGEVVAMLTIGAGVAATLLPMAMHHLADRLPGFAAHSPLLGMAAVSVALLAAASLWVAYRGAPEFAGLTGAEEVAGRASAVGGDVLKVGGTTVRLSGIESPEHAQVCGRSNSRWRCAEAAQAALAKIVSAPSVRCQLTGTDKAGRPRGICAIESADINAELVRQGVAFAEGGPSGRYGVEEAEARNARAGMWVGAVQRPEEIRARAWEEAKRRSPDGCPIKGQVTGVHRVYVLPGAPSYDRVRVLPARGDRWFCSEQEATAAGFKAAQRG